MHERENYEVPNILFAHKKPRDPREYPYGKFYDMYWKIQKLLSSLIGTFYLESPEVTALVVCVLKIGKEERELPSGVNF